MVAGIPGYQPDVPAPGLPVSRDRIGYVEGGDYVRGSAGADTTQTALRYPTSSDTLAEAAARRGILYTRPYDYNTIEIFWGIPDKLWDQWAEVSIVRSAFGYPATVNDGQTIFRNYRATLFPGEVPENFVFEPIYDVRDPTTGGKPRLTPGRFYYYSLFFRINFQWFRSMTASSLLPRDHHHAEHLWDTLPPYYQWVDNQQRDMDGDLKRFLRVFGFELDTWREYVENWQEVYHIDFSPVPLLRRLGPTFGVPYEAGIGEIRYRSLLSELGLLYGIRGTRPCLEKVCEAVSKYECDVTQTGNLMTLPDDSDFFEGTGNWAGLNTALNPDTILAPADVTLLEPRQGALQAHQDRAAPRGLRALGDGDMDSRGRRDDGRDAHLRLRHRLRRVPGQGHCGVDNPYGPRYIYPIQVGVLADESGVYSFSCQIKMEVPYPVDLMILWYDTDGGVMDYIGKSTAGPVAPPNTNWKSYQCTGTVPPGGVYAVPAIYLKTRVGGPMTGKSPSVYIAGAAVYNFGSAKRVSSEAPNPYLEMGNVMKRIGDPTDTPPAPDAGQPPLPAPYPGYQIGQKQ